MPDSVTIKRDVILRAVVTEQLKQEIDEEFTEAINEIDRRITQIDISGRQYVTEMQRTNIQQAMALRQQLEGEKRRFQQSKDQLIQRQRQVADLELGAEIIRGTLESHVELKLGDSLQTVLRGIEVVVKDDKVIEVRETPGGIRPELDEEVTAESAPQIELP